MINYRIATAIDCWEIRVMFFDSHCAVSGLLRQRNVVKNRTPNSPPHENALFLLEKLSRSKSEKRKKRSKLVVALGRVDNIGCYQLTCSGQLRYQSSLIGQNRFSPHTLLSEYVLTAISLPRNDLNFEFSGKLAPPQ